jgi:hypothetical protein
MAGPNDKKPPGTGPAPLKEARSGRSEFEESAPNLPRAREGAAEFVTVAPWEAKTVGATKEDIFAWQQKQKEKAKKVSFLTRPTDDGVEPPVAPRPIVVRRVPQPLVLPPEDRRRLATLEERALQADQSAGAALIERAAEVGFTPEQVDSALTFLSRGAQLTLNFSPSNEGTDVALLSALRSHQGCSLNAELHALGGMPDKGPCYLVLNEDVKQRASLQVQIHNSGGQPQGIGTPNKLKDVLLQVAQKSRTTFKSILGTWLNPTQANQPSANWGGAIVADPVGALDLAHVDRVVIHVDYKGTPLEAKLRKFAEQHKLGLCWTDGHTIAPVTSW